MTLLNEVESLWATKHEELVAKWAETLEPRLPDLLNAGKRFHSFAPLDTYLSVTRAQKPSIAFSLRFLGQAVAELVADEDLTLRIDDKLAESNKKFFECSAQGSFSWADRRATEFRKHFKSKKLQNARGAIFEHEIEAEFLKQMARTDRAKFGGSLASIQPVALAGCRFQFPLPLSASSGKPKDTRGNIDILARRGSGRGTRLSVWELKAPGAKAMPVEQAYIYSITLQKILRSRSRGFWYKNVFGFKGGVPKRLIIESVVAIHAGNEAEKRRFEQKLVEFSGQEALQIGDDKIKLCVAFYDYSRKGLTVQFREIA